MKAIRARSPFPIACALLAALVLPVASLAGGGGTADGGELCMLAQTAGKGRFIAFTSGGTNLVDSDSNGQFDIFVHDTKAGTTTIETVATDGTQANDSTLFSTLSADGRWVAFGTDASNLVPDDTNGTTDVFLRDRKQGTTTRISLDKDGQEANGDSFGARMSAKGRWIAFSSNSTDLVDDDTNGKYDAFLLDTKTGETTRLSVSSEGEQGNGDSFVNSISANGRWVAISSAATNLVEGDSNAITDGFLHDRKTGLTERFTLAFDGAQPDSTASDGMVSNSGRWLAWQSNASNLVPGDTPATQDVFVRDRKKGVTVCASVTPLGAVANDHSFCAAGGLSTDGRWLAFESAATDILDPDGTATGDIILRDLKKGVSIRASVAFDGAPGNQGGSDAVVSASGRRIAFASSATNLVEQTVTDVPQIFVHDRKAGTTEAVSVSSAGELASD